jgi:ligand-binding sensor domain-containing protein
MYEDRNGVLWFGTNGEGAWRFDGQRFHRVGAEAGIEGASVRGITEDREGKLWLATSAGLAGFDGQRWSLYTTAIDAPSNDFWSLATARDGGLWVGGLRGLWRFDGERFRSVVLPVLARETEPIFDRRQVWALAEDHDRNLWVGTDGGGLVRTDGRSSRLYTVADGLPADTISCLLVARDGRLWVGGRTGGVARFDGERFTTLPELDAWSTIAWTLFEDRDGVIWLGSAGDSLHRLTGEGLRRYGADDGLQNRHVQSLMQTRDGNFWLGTSGGLYRREGERFVEVTRPEER